jgi:uncharacterized membrane protein
LASPPRHLIVGFVRYHLAAGASQVNIDPANMVPWSSDWLWSLPLSVMTVVIHVIGLFFIRRRFDRVLVQASQRRMKMIAMLFMAGTTVLDSLPRFFTP